MQALYDSILEDERVLEDAFKHEVRARQAEASDDQALIEFFRTMRDENRRRAERPSGSWPRGCLRKFHAEREEERQDAAGQEPCP